MLPSILVTQLAMEPVALELNKDLRSQGESPQRRDSSQLYPATWHDIEHTGHQTGTEHQLHTHTPQRIQYRGDLQWL